jgi:hypothetical protein
MNNLRASLTDGLGIATANILTFLPKLLIFIAIVVGGYFLAKFLAKMFDKLLERLHFDNLVERGGVKRVLQKAGCDASDVMGKLLFYGLFLFVLQFAFGIFGPNPISNLLTQIIAYIPNILVAAIIIIVASAVGKGVSDILNISLGGLGYGRVLAKAAGAAIVVVGVFAALNQLGIAPAIVNGLFYAMLAIIVGSSVVAIGGGGIKPMQQVWERGIDRAQAEVPRVKAQAEQNRLAVAKKTEQWKATARDAGETATRESDSPSFHPHD